MKLFDNVQFADAAVVVFQPEQEVYQSFAVTAMSVGNAGKFYRIFDCFKFGDRRRVGPERIFIAEQIKNLLRCFMLIKTEGTLAERF